MRRPLHSWESHRAFSHVFLNTLELEGDWSIIRRKLKQKWAALTDDDLQLVEGKQEELMSRIQRRTGQARDAVEATIRDYRASLAERRTVHGGEIGFHPIARGVCSL